MFSRANRNQKDKQQSDKHIREEARADENIILNTSIGNQAMIENILDLENLEEKIPDPDFGGAGNDLPMIHEKDTGPGNPIANKHKKRELIGMPERDSVLEDSGSENDSDSGNLIINKYKNKPLLDLPLLNPDPDLSESKKEPPHIKFNIMNDDDSEDNDSIREENEPKKEGLGFIAGIIASVNKRDNGGDDDIEDNISELFPKAGKKKRLEDTEENLLEIDTGPKQEEQEEILNEMAKSQNLLQPGEIAPPEGQAGNRQIPPGPDEFDDSDDDGTGSTYDYKLSYSSADEESEKYISNKKKRKPSKQVNERKDTVEGMDALDPDKKWKEEGLEYVRSLGNASPDFIGKEMKRLKNWNFAAQRMEDTPKMSAAGVNSSHYSAGEPG